MRLRSQHYDQASCVLDPGMLLVLRGDAPPDESKFRSFLTRTLTRMDAYRVNWAQEDARLAGRTCDSGARRTRASSCWLRLDARWSTRRSTRAPTRWRASWSGPSGTPTGPSSPRRRRPPAVGLSSRALEQLRRSSESRSDALTHPPLTFFSHATSCLLSPLP